MRTLLARSLACLVIAAPCAGGEGAAPAVPDTGTVAAGPFRLRYRIEGTGRPALVIGCADTPPYEEAELFDAELLRWIEGGR